MAIHDDLGMVVEAAASAGNLATILSSMGDNHGAVEIAQRRWDALEGLSGTEPAVLRLASALKSGKLRSRSLRQGCRVCRSRNPARGGHQRSRGPQCLLPPGRVQVPAPGCSHHGCRALSGISGHRPALQPRQSPRRCPDQPGLGTVRPRSRRGPRNRQGGDRGRTPQRRPDQYRSGHLQLPVMPLDCRSTDGGSGTPCVRAGERGRCRRALHARCRESVALGRNRNRQHDFASRSQPRCHLRRPVLPCMVRVPAHGRIHSTRGFSGGGFNRRVHALARVGHDGTRGRVRLPMAPAGPCSPGSRRPRHGWSGSWRQ